MQLRHAGFNMSALPFSQTGRDRRKVAPARPAMFARLMRPHNTAERLRRQIAFLTEVDKLKEVFRQTIVTQSRRAENSAEHSWHFALMVVVLAEHSNHQPLDVLRILKMVLIHDLVEIDAGDTFAYDTKLMADQHEREARAADRIFGLLPEDQAAEFRALWDEFEARQTPEARFAAACDRFHPMLLNCLTQGHAWRKHGITQDRVLARNAHVAEGSRVIWEYAAKMIDEAVAQGHLAPAPAHRPETGLKP
jgi:putative hydrolase of HD superfamily